MHRSAAVGLVFAALLSASPQRASAEDKMRVVLLGTAGPEYFPDRLGISTLVEANGQKLLFDVGRGANQRDGQACRDYTAVVSSRTSRLKPPTNSAAAQTAGCASAPATGAHVPGPIG